MACCAKNGPSRPNEVYIYKSGKQGGFALGFITYRVGRATDADVHLDHPEVSRRQVELTRTPTGRYYLVDCAGSCGTYFHDGTDWVRLIQGYAMPDTRLRFGEHRLRLSDLLDRLPSSREGVENKFEPVSVRPRRKLDTGEVELVRGSGHT